MVATTRGRQKVPTVTNTPKTMGVRQKGAMGVRKPVPTKKTVPPKKTEEKKKHHGRYKGILKKEIQTGVKTRYEYSASGDPDAQMVDHIVDAVFSNENKMNELKNILNLDSSFSSTIRLYEKILFQKFLKTRLSYFKDDESTFDGRRVKIVFTDLSDVKDFFMMQYLDMCHDFPQLRQPGKILNDFDTFFKDGVWPWIDKMNRGVDNRLRNAILNPSTGNFLTEIYQPRQNPQRRVFGRTNWESQVFQILLNDRTFKIRIPRHHIFVEGQKPVGTMERKMILDMSSSGHLRVIYNQFASMLPLCLLVDAGQHFLPENNTVNHMWNAYLEHVDGELSPRDVNGAAVDREKIADDLEDMLKDERIHLKLESMRLHWWKSRSNNLTPTPTPSRISTPGVNQVNPNPNPNPNNFLPNQSPSNQSNNNNRMSNNNRRNQAIQLKEELIDYIIRYGNARQADQVRKIRYPYNPWEALAFLKVLIEGNANRYQTIDDIRQLINRHNVGDALLNNNNNSNALLGKKYLIDVQPFAYSVWFKYDNREICLHDVLLESFKPSCGTRPLSKAYYTSLTINQNKCNTIQSVPLVSKEIVPRLNGPDTYTTLLQKHLGDFIPILYSLVHGYIYGTGDKMAATSYLILYKFLSSPRTFTYMSMYARNNPPRWIEHSGGRNVSRDYFSRRIFVEGRGNKDTFYISDIMNEQYLRKSRRLDKTARNRNLQREIDRLQAILNGRRATTNRTRSRE